jgi:hypothetical protein
VRAFTGPPRLDERYNLWTLAHSIRDRPGAFAEAGVHRGGSAKILCEVKGDAPLHLFDTFAGMPTVNPATDGAFRAGDFSDSSLAHVQAFLARYPNVHFHPGVFPASAAPFANQQLTFKFLHLDLDLHASTRDALEWFYPRMARGGLIVSHDYGDLSVPGVKLAFDEFFRDKPEPVVPIWFSQVLVVKL